jgi:hypothetical protein
LPFSRERIRLRVIYATSISIYLFVSSTVKTLFDVTHISRGGKSFHQGNKASHTNIISSKLIQEISDNFLTQYALSTHFLVISTEVAHHISILNQSKCFKISSLNFFLISKLGSHLCFSSNGASCHKALKVICVHLSSINSHHIFFGLRFKLSILILKASIISFFSFSVKSKLYCFSQFQFL